jgi:hypothetical protein
MLSREFATTGNSQEERIGTMDEIRQKYKKQDLTMPKIHQERWACRNLPQIESLSHNFMREFETLP